MLGTSSGMAPRRRYSFTQIQKVMHQDVYHCPKYASEDIHIFLNTKQHCIGGIKVMSEDVITSPGIDTR